jgi:hypothetical protein
MMSEAPQWFVAVLLLRAEVEGRSAAEALVDHQVRLVQASSTPAALERAEVIGRAEEHAYANERGEQVRWRFLGLHDLVALEAGALADGGELYSWRLLQPEALRVVPPDELTVVAEARQGSTVARDVLDEHR